MNHEQFTSSMPTIRTETTHGLTYSVDIYRVDGGNRMAVYAVCHCCLTHSSCHWTQIS